MVGVFTIADTVVNGNKVGWRIGKVTEEPLTRGAVFENYSFKIYLADTVSSVLISYSLCSLSFLSEFTRLEKNPSRKVFQP